MGSWHFVRYFSWLPMLGDFWNIKNSSENIVTLCCALGTRVLLGVVRS